MVHVEDKAKILKAEVGDKPRPSDQVAYLIGVNVPEIQLNLQFFEEFRGLKVIHWVGTDVLKALRAPEAVKPLVSPDIIHLAVAEHLKHELAPLGILSSVVTLPPLEQFQILPFPKMFTVGVYAPDNRRDFYSIPVCLQAAEDAAHITFRFYGCGQRGRERNKIFCGWVDMQDFVPQCSALLRVTDHDGFPISIQQFGQAGRHCLSNWAFPYVNRVTPDVESILNGIEQIRNKPPNKEASDFYSHFSSHDTYLDSLLVALTLPR